MKIDRVVYLTQTPFSKRDKDRFGIDIFLDHNIDVAVLDITPYMDSFVAKNYVLDSNEATYDYVKKMESFSEIKKFVLNASPNTVFISFIGESSVRSLRVLNLLFKNKNEFGIILSGSLPSIKSSKGILGRLKLLSLKNIKRLTGKAVYMLLCAKFDYSFVIASGEDSYRTIQNRYKSSGIINGHAFDYDLYLQFNQEHTTFDGKRYAVFLDEFFPFHPDYIRHGVDYSSFADAYYKKLDVFFDVVEKTFNLEVIISAHPRSYYERLPDYYNGRKIIKGDTIGLVKGSQMCLLHASTSVNFAVLYEKPTIFLTMEEIKQSNVEVMLEAMSDELNSPTIDLDFFKNNLVEIKYDKERYNIYKNRYIKRDNNPDINNWELLYRYFSDK